jgi:hypothetical protein
MFPIQFVLIQFVPIQIVPIQFVPIQFVHEPIKLSICCEAVTFAIGPLERYIQVNSTVLSFGYERRIVRVSIILFSKGDKF